MKKMIACMAVVIAIFSVSSVYAQDQGNRQQRMAEMKQKMKDDLKLTDLQADSISSIQGEFMPKRREIFMDQSMGQEDKKAKIMALNEQADKRIHAVLGDDLFKK